MAGLALPPGYRAGTWNIDALYSHATFTVRHLVVAKARGTFHGIHGSIELADDPTASVVSAEIDLSRIVTETAQRSADILSAGILDGERYPTMRYRSSAIRRSMSDRGDAFLIDGVLSLHGVTRSVELAISDFSFPTAASPSAAALFRATALISRRDFGIEIPFAARGALVGDTITVDVEIAAVLAPVSSPTPTPTSSNTPPRRPTSSLAPPVSS